MGLGEIDPRMGEADPPRNVADEGMPGADRAQARETAGTTWEKTREGRPPVDFEKKWRRIPPPFPTARVRTARSNPPGMDPGLAASGRR
jgi:hypothetical protein